MLKKNYNRRLPILLIALLSFAFVAPAFAEEEQGPNCNGNFQAWLKSHPKVIANLTARKEALESRGLPPAIDRKIAKTTAMVETLTECQDAEAAGAELPGHCKRNWPTKLEKLTTKVEKLEGKKESVAARFAKKLERMGTKIAKFQNQLDTATAACSA